MLNAGLQHWEYFLLNSLAMVLLMGCAAYAAGKNSVSRSNTLLYSASIPLIFLSGARLFYLLFYSDYNNPLVHVYDLKLYGFSLYGGLLLVFLYSAAVARLSHITVLKWLDDHTPALMSYVALGKTGCFFNGCCFGTPTVMPWGIPCTPGSQAYNYYIIQAFSNLQQQAWQVYSDRLHPVQLYESGVALILLLLAFILFRKKVIPGLVFLLTAGLYSLARLGLFYFRANPEPGTFLHLLPWLYIMIAGLSLGMLLIKLICTNLSWPMAVPTNENRSMGN